MRVFVVPYVYVAEQGHGGVLVFSDEKKAEEFIVNPPAGYVVDSPYPESAIVDEVKK